MQYISNSGRLVSPCFSHITAHSEIVRILTKIHNTHCSRYRSSIRICATSEITTVTPSNAGSALPI